MAVVIALATALPARAETLHCTLAPDCTGPGPCATALLELRFAIDRNQFAPAIDPGDPPRRKVTQVIVGRSSFEAEPILMDSGVRGFWTDDAVNGAQVLTIQPDGSAIYSAPDGTAWTGRCEETG